MRPYGWTLTGKVAHLIDYGSTTLCGIQAPYRMLGKGDGKQIRVCKRCRKVSDLDRAAMAASLDRGLKQAAAGETEDLGSFYYAPTMRVQFRDGETKVTHFEVAIPVTEDSENDGGKA